MCSTCKKPLRVKAKELLSFERVFGAFEIVTLKSTFDNLFEFKKRVKFRNLFSRLHTAELLTAEQYPLK